MFEPGTRDVDLSGAAIFGAHRKSLVDIVDEFDMKVAMIRKRKDPELEGSRRLFRRIPFALLNVALGLIGWLSFTLNLDLRWAGIPQDPFGSALVTNIGSLGLEGAYVPLVPYNRVPLLVAVGAVTDESVVDDGRIVVGKTLRVFATFDHRVLDGVHMARMSKTLRRVFADPQGELGAIAEAGNPP